MTELHIWNQGEAEGPPPKRTLRSWLIRLIWTLRSGIFVRIKPCKFCGEFPDDENCDYPPCNCGSGYVQCLNDDCPEQPCVDQWVGSVCRTHEERIAIWNREFGSRWMLFKALL